MSEPVEFIINNLPEGFYENELSALLRRFGTAPKIQMVDSAKTCEKGVLVHYTNKTDGLAAMELLKRYFLNGERLQVCWPSNKPTLYVTNLPKELPARTLQDAFLKIFPKMQRAEFPGSNLFGNWGCAFVAFDSHQDALEAKNSYNSLGLRMLGVNLKIISVHDQPTVLEKSKNTFTVKGFENTFIKSEILKTIEKLVIPSEYRDTQISHNGLTISFPDEAVASRVFAGMEQMEDQNLVLECTESNLKTSVSELTLDYCAELRMICIANGWRIPVILFGRRDREKRIQYGSILLTNKANEICAGLMEVNVDFKYDSQQTMCKWMVKFINRCRGFPSNSFVCTLKDAKPECNHIILLVSFPDCFFMYSLRIFPLLSLSDVCEKQEETIKDWKSIQEMATALEVIRTYSEDEVLSVYKDSLLVKAPDACIFSNCLPVYRKYRNISPLKYNLNDTEIILVLRGGTRDENKVPTTSTLFTSMFSYENIDAGRNDYCPERSSSVQPNWIPGTTYSHSAKNIL